MPAATAGAIVEDMTTTASTPPAAGRRSVAGHTPRPAPFRRTATVVAVLACVPYLALKTAWLAGSEIGIPAGSALLDPDRRAVLYAANALTLLMDATVIVLVLALTRPWGRRLPGRLLALPLWVASGLLGPIVVAFPLQVATAPFTSGGGAASPEDPFLDAWVFTLVYTGFLVQALALGWLFTQYALARWGHLLRDRSPWRPGELTGVWGRRAALAAALLTLPVAALRLLWLGGLDLALPSGQIAERDAAFELNNGVQALFALVALAAAALLARRAGGRLPAPGCSHRVLLLLGWTGSSVSVAWGSWMLLAGSLPGDDGGLAFTPLMNMSYAAQVIAGLLLLGLGARLLTGRNAAAAAPPDRAAPPGAA